MNLHTERTILRPLAESDFDDILVMYREPDSNRYIPNLMGLSDESYGAFLRTKIAANALQVGFWTVRDRLDGRFIGTVNLNTYRDSAISHIGCHLRRKFWKQGYAFELLSVLRDYGIEGLELPYIHGIFSNDHHVSEDLMIKLGFVPCEESSLDLQDAKIYRFPE